MTTTTNIASELILYKDLVEHQQKLIIQLEKKVEVLRDLANLYKEQRDQKIEMNNRIRKIHLDYVEKVQTGLDSLLV
jgi:hypothetical protein